MQRRISGSTVVGCLCAAVVFGGCAEDSPGEEGTAGIGVSAGTGAGSDGGAGATAGDTGVAGTTSGTTGGSDAAGTGAGTDAAGMGGAGSDGTAGGPTDPECDMNGTWISVQHTVNTALSAPQISTNWSYFTATHEGDGFTMNGLNCGFAVRGTTDVSLSDRTLQELAMRTRQGRTGTFKLNEAGDACAFSIDRNYVLRGANMQTFLHDIWQYGDPPKSLDEFTLPANAAEGMEDWDEDGNEGITLLTGLGDRYVAQIDWSEVTGTAPLNSKDFGGEDVVVVDYDSREAVSTQTSFLLQATATPMPPGWAFFYEIGDELQITDSELDTCKNVVAAAVAKWGDPVTP